MNGDVPSTAPRDRGLSTAREVLRVLSYIAESPRGVTASDVADRVHRSRSTAYHLLASLEAEGFVARRGRAGRYRLNPDKPGAPAPAPPDSGAFAPNLDAVQEGMHEVFARTGRRTYIGCFSDDGVALLRDVGRQGVPRMANLEKPLIRRTAHALAIGKLLLAGLEGDRLDRWVAEHSLRSFTPSTIADPRQLAVELADVRERGVATDHGEYDVDFGSVASPVLGPTGRPVAALGVTTTRAQLAAEREDIEGVLLSVTAELNAMA